MVGVAVADLLMIEIKNGVKIYPDGREVCLKTKAGREEYADRTFKMWVRQKLICYLCGKRLEWTDATFDHERSRGLGGGNREDRIEIDSAPVNGAAHYLCNSRKGSMSLEKWREHEQQRRNR